jgi:hypothetical protein
LIPGTTEKFNNVLPYLGLQERKPYPCHVALDDQDPLGSKIVDKVTGLTDAGEFNLNKVFKNV